MKSGNHIFVVLIALQLINLPLYGEESAHAHAHDEDRADPVLDSDIPIEEQFGEGGGISSFLFPHLHAFGVFGDSTTDPADLAVGDHDPNNNATLQSIEPSLALQAGMLQGYVNASGTTDGNGDFSFALEEGFMKLVDLPLELEIRGGQFLNRFGFQNDLHNHDWKFVDQNLVNGRFLNEGELASLGGEVSWKMPLLEASLVTISVGAIPDHAHGEAGHGHSDDSDFETEGADFVGTLVAGNWVNHFDFDDAKRLNLIVSGAWGDNRFGRRSQVYGLGLEYLWREHEHGEPAHSSKSLRWRNEVMIRNIAAVSGHLSGEEEESDHEEKSHDEKESGRQAGFDEFGIYSMLVYGINDHVETGVRGGWVSGINKMGLDERYRVSPMITWYLNKKRTLQARLQYNWDHFSRTGTEHSLWFQIGFNWEAEGARHEHDH